MARNKRRSKDGAVLKPYHDKLLGMTAPLVSVTDNLYAKLKREGQLNRFISLIKVCSSKGMNIKETCEAIYATFPGYIIRQDFNDLSFARMCKDYTDISVAWGYGNYGDDISLQMIKDRATELALNTSKIEEIKVYHDIYNKVDNTKPIDTIDNKLNFTYKKI